MRSAGRAWLMLSTALAGAGTAGVAIAQPTPPPAEAPKPAEAPPPPSTDPAPPPPEPEPEPIEVTVREPPKQTDATKMTRAETRTMPGAFGDPFRAIESVPSVVPLASGVPYFYVRGAPPGDVGYFIGGIRVPLLFHMGLGPSVIHPALIDSVEIVPGPAPEAGRFAGGVVQGALTAPRESFRVEGNLRAVDTGAFVEVPFDHGRGDVLAAGRIAYTALLFSLLSSDVVLDYWDYASRFSYEVAPGHRVGVFGFGAYDHLANKVEGKDDELLFDTMFHRLDAFYEVDLSPKTKGRFDVVLGFDKTRLAENDEVIDRSLSVKAELRGRLGDEAEWLTGFDFTTDDYDADLAEVGDDGFQSFFTPHTDRVVGAFAVFPFRLGRLALRPGVRADYYLSGERSALAIDPSLSLRLDITGNLALVSTHGLASQMPSFIVAGPGFRPPLDDRGLQRSFSSSVGLELKPDESTTLKATGYRSAFFDLNDALGTSGLGGETFPDGLDHFDRRFRGWAAGLELSLKRRMTKSLGANLTYSLGRSVRVDEHGKSFPSGFDRTHVATAALTYDFGRGYSFGMRHLFYTGTPLLEDSDEGVRVVRRLPPFYRLDWRFEKRWTIGKRGWVSFIAEVLNTFLAAETLSEDCARPDACSPSKLGPVTIPSLGVEGAY